MGVSVYSYVSKGLHAENTYDQAWGRGGAVHTQSLVGVGRVHFRPHPRDEQLKNDECS